MLAAIRTACSSDRIMLVAIIACHAKLHPTTATADAILLARVHIERHLRARSERRRNTPATAETP